MVTEFRYGFNIRGLQCYGSTFLEETVIDMVTLSWKRTSEIWLYYLGIGNSEL